MKNLLIYKIGIIALICFSINVNALKGEYLMNIGVLDDNLVFCDYGYSGITTYSTAYLNVYLSDTNMSNVSLTGLEKIYTTSTSFEGIMNLDLEYNQTITKNSYLCNKYLICNAYTDESNIFGGHDITMNTTKEIYLSCENGMFKMNYGSDSDRINFNIATQYFVMFLMIIFFSIILYGFSKMGR